MGEFSFQYPASFIVFCLLCGLGLSLLLYYKSKTWNDRPRWHLFLLGFLRFLSGSLIAFLLLNPLFKNFKKEIRKPVLVYLEDNSRSLIAKDSSWKENYIDQRTSILKDLEEKYDIKKFEFGNQCSSDFTNTYNQNKSNPYAAFDHVSDVVDIQNVKAVLLHSDGIYNSGRNPLYHPLLKLSPIHTILQGDTIPEKDLAIQRVYHNEIIYSGDKFSVQLDIQAFHSNGEKFNFQVLQYDGNGTKKIYESSENIKSNSFFTTKEILIDANQVGLQRYKVIVSNLSGERNTRNNQRDIFIEVLDSKKKVLIYALSPHPDLSAMKDALLSNKNYDVVIKYYPEAVGNVDQFTLAILHQIPGLNSSSSSTISLLQNQKIPLVYVLGNLSDLGAFNAIQNAVSINGNTKNQNESQAVVNTAFTLFTMSEPLQSAVAKFPPLSVPFGNFKMDPSSSTFLFQKIGKVETNYPLWIFQNQNGNKSSMIMGEGLWKWRMNDYINTNSFTNFNELMSKMVLFVASKDDKRKFKVTQSKKLFEEVEPIIFNAELYNDSYEKVNEPEVKLDILSKDKKSYTYSLGKKENYYELNIGSLPAGQYSYKASTSWNNKSQIAEGIFGVEAIDVETNSLLADHNLLRNISEQSTGKSFSAAHLEDLKNLLLEDQSSKSIIYQHLDIKPLLNEKWIFFIIAFLLALEWFLRRFWGSY